MGCPPVMGRLHTRYAPVRRSYCYALALHVLGLPLALILSQDQTLHCKMILIVVRRLYKILTYGLPHHFKELVPFSTVCLNWECKGRNFFIMSIPERKKFFISPTFSPRFS